MKWIALFLTLGLMNSPAVAQTTSAAKVPAPGAAHPSPPVVVNNSISPAEWQEYRVAREAALKANPALLKNAVELSKKMHDFQKELDAAMLQTDPGVGVIVTKLEGSRPGVNGPSMLPPRPQ